MITTRELRLVGALLTGATLLACANDSTAPVSSSPVTASRVFTTFDLFVSASRISPSTYRMATIAGLNNEWLTASARDQHGELMIVKGGSFSISSDNPSVATVGDAVPAASQISAKIRAIAPGEAVVSVTWTIGGVTKTAKTTIIVEATTGWSLKLDPAALTVNVGKVVPVEAQLRDARGALRSWAPSVFTSDRDDVVAFYYDDWSCGLFQACPYINVRGVALGEAIITARLEGFSATIKVTVVP